MNEQIKKKWVKALRSGEYDQCTNQLAIGDDCEASFCCLGVLTNIYAEEHNEDFDVVDDNGYNLPDKVSEWAELERCSPWVPYDLIKIPAHVRGAVDWLQLYQTTHHNKVNVAVLNDQGLSFKQIATLISKYL